LPQYKYFSSQLCLPKLFKAFGPEIGNPKVEIKEEKRYKKLMTAIEAMSRIIGDLVLDLLFTDL
jgi:hypothetical protein